MRCVFLLASLLGHCLALLPTFSEKDQTYLNQIDSSTSLEHSSSRRKGGPITIVDVSSSCAAATNMSVCSVLVGASLSVSSLTQSESSQTQLLDNYLSNAYTQATTTFWNFSNTIVKVAPSAACRMAFSSLFCLNSQILASYGLNGSCGVSANSSFIACYSRCMQYQISCLGLSGSAAAAACQASASSSNPWNAPSDSNCFCGDNFIFGASQYDICTGPCDPASECGSCPTIPRLNTCYTLVGGSLSVSNSSMTVQQQAYALDTYVANGYAAAASPAGWNFSGQIVRINPSPACQVAFNSYYCTNHHTHY